MFIYIHINKTNIRVKGREKADQLGTPDPGKDMAVSSLSFLISSCSPE